MIFTRETSPGTSHSFVANKQSPVDPMPTRAPASHPPVPRSEAATTTQATATAEPATIAEGPSSTVVRHAPSVPAARHSATPEPAPIVAQVHNSLLRAAGTSRGLTLSLR